MPTIMTVKFEPVILQFSFLENLNSGTTANLSSSAGHLLLGNRTNNASGQTSGGAVFYHQFSGGTYGSSLQTLTAGDPENSAFFGYEVAINGTGDTAAISARSDDAVGSDSGAVYMFTRSGSTWSQAQKIVPSGLSSNDQIGDEGQIDISNDGNTVVMGTPRHNSAAGRVWVFFRSATTWTEQGDFEPAGLANIDQLGWNVAISGDGDTVAGSAIGDDDGASNTGAIYVFTRSGSTWSQQAKVQADDRRSNQNLGGDASRHAHALVLSQDGNTMIAGAESDYEGGSLGNDFGAVYVFTRSGSTWSQSQKIVLDSQTINDRFGRSVDMSDDGTWLIVGSDNGNAYVYRNVAGTYSQTQVISPFGENVRISKDGNTITDELGRIWNR